MNTELDVECLWIPHEYGGRRAEPFVGMRSMIRWQQYLREHLELSRDVECKTLAYDRVTGRGTATLRLLHPATVPNEWLKHGTLIELLEGHAVIAVARITAARQRTLE